MLVAFLSEPHLPQILQKMPHLPHEGFSIHSCLINPTLYSFSIESVALTPAQCPAPCLAQHGPLQTPILSSGPSKRGPQWGTHSEHWAHSPCSWELRAKAAVAFCHRRPQRKVQGRLPPSWLVPLEYSGTSVTRDRRWERTKRVERAAGIRVCSGVVPSTPRALWVGHQTVLSWTTPSGRG